MTRSVERKFSVPSVLMAGYSVSPDRYIKLNLNLLEVGRFAHSSRTRPLVLAGPSGTGENSSARRRTLKCITDTRRRTTSPWPSRGIVVLFGARSRDASLDRSRGRGEGRQVRTRRSVPSRARRSVRQRARNRERRFNLIWVYLP